MLFGARELELLTPEIENYLHVLFCSFVNTKNINLLTCDGEGNDLGDNAADAVPRDALVVAGVAPTYRL